MTSSNLLTLLRALTTGVQDVLVAVKDVRNVNREAEKVGKTGTLDVQDPSLTFEIESFQHSLREAVIFAGRFVVASKHLAKYASNEGQVQQIKDDLDRGKYHRLKPFLDGLASQLSRCRQRVEEYQTEYSKANDKTRQLSERSCRERSAATHTVVTEHDITTSSYIAGVFCALFLPGLVALIIREFSLLYIFIYACLGVGGFFAGKIGCTFFMRSRLTLGSQRVQDRKSYSNELHLQSTQDSIAKFLAKAQETKGKLLRLEQCAKEAAELVGKMGQHGISSDRPLYEDRCDEIKAQIGDLKQQMLRLLKCTDEESDNEQLK